VPAIEQRRRDGLIILVVEDIEETRDGIERLLRADGYLIEAARDEEDAVARGGRSLPALILVSLGGVAENVIATARRIRERAGMSEEVPIVIFCAPEIEEGTEINIGRNVYLSRPDNFNQLRNLLHRLLCEPRPAA
jgi:two-component system, OmpR family, response regulator